MPLRFRLLKCCAFLLILLAVSPGYTQSVIDTVTNYLQLRLYTGGADTVFVDHPRYYGTFHRTKCLNEDYGTTIIVPTHCWQRITNNFSPRYWALPGPAPDTQIGRVEREVDAINCAAFAAYLAGGDTIEIDRMYEIDRPVWLYPNNTYLGTEDSCGFARIDPPKTTLLDTAFVNDNFIKVADNTGFRTRQLINIANGQAFDSLAKHVSYLASISSFSGGDTVIWLSGRRIQRTMLPGDSVSLFFPMMERRYSIPLDGMRFENLIFQGNRSAYQLNYDWRVNSTIRIPTVDDVVINRCRFYNISNENLVLCGARVENCEGLDLNGSFAHVSCDSTALGTEVLYNRVLYMNEVGDDIMRHSEGAIPFSAKVQNLRVAYNEFRHGGEYGIGVFNNDDSFNEITDNLLQVVKDSVGFQFAYLYPETNLIYNNKFPDETDTTTNDCWVTTPTVVTGCSGGSSFDHPFLPLGDTLVLMVDSIQLRKSQENFVKLVRPIYDSTYFRLVGMRLQTADLSVHHQWTFDPNAMALVFDNGHRSGPFGEGNWGFEGCAELGGCTQLELIFEAVRFPTEFTQAVDCPLEGIEVAYDGDVGTWAQIPTCAGRSVAFSISEQPVLAGQYLPILTGSQEVSEQEINIHPNPAKDYIDVQPVQLSPLNTTIIDPLGSVVQQGRSTGNRIDVSDIPSGTYFLRLEWAEGLVIRRFVKL